MRILHWGWFEDLAVLQREGCFVQAAEKLSITQSALSQRIQKLEDEVGIVWFESSQAERTPSPWRIYQQAAAMGRMVSEHGGLQDLPALEALLCD